MTKHMGRATMMMLIAFTIAAIALVLLPVVRAAGTAVHRGLLIVRVCARRHFPAERGREHRGEQDRGKESGYFS